MEARVKTLLAQSKTVDAETAVQIALLNNKGLQAAYADLGDAGADVWQSMLLVNPTVAVGLTGIGTPGLQAYRAIEGALAVNILALATRDRRSRSQSAFEQAQLVAALKTHELAAIHGAPGSMRSPPVKQQYSSPGSDHVRSSVPIGAGVGKSGLDDQRLAGA